MFFAFSFSFGFFFFFIFWKKGDQILSQHIKVFYLSHWIFTLSPHEGLAPSSKVQAILLYSQMGFPLSSKGFDNWFKKISSFNPHWALALVSLAMSLGFRASKLSQSMDGFDIFSIKPITYSWSWALLLWKKVFEFQPKS